MKDFIISCESTVDMPYSYFKKNEVPVLFYEYILNGETFKDNMEKSEDDIKTFYDNLLSGDIPATSQINEYRYTEFFNSLIKDGTPLLHIAFGSGMTKSVFNAISAAEKINKEKGEELVTVIDSKCSSSGYGMLVSYAVDSKKDGKTLEETAIYINSIKERIHHQFFSTEMKFYKKSGRVSGSEAAIATILGICPIMRLNKAGSIEAYGKTRGKKNAIQTTLDAFLEKCENGKEYDGKCYIVHSMCMDTALTLKKEIEKTFLHLKNKTEIFDIGNIVGSHCGPGTVAVFFLGNERE